MAKAHKNLASNPTKCPVAVLADEYRQLMVGYAIAKKDNELDCNYLALALQRADAVTNMAVWEKPKSLEGVLFLLRCALANHEFIYLPRASRTDSLGSDGARDALLAIGRAEVFLTEYLGLSFKSVDRYNLVMSDVELGEITDSIKLGG